MVTRITEPIVLDVSTITLDGDLPTGSERGDTIAIGQLHTLALEATASQVQAIRLLVFAAIDLAELAENAPDVLTAMIAVIREWRDGRGPRDGVTPAVDED